jgi:hypothetical protein
MNPLRTVRDAVALPFSALFVVAVCVAINAFTSPGHWWAQWVALGMGIAVFAAWARALKLAIAAGGLAWLAHVLLRQRAVDTARHRTD